MDLLWNNPLKIDRYKQVVITPLGAEKKVTLELRDFSLSKSHQQAIQDITKLDWNIYSFNIPESNFISVYNDTPFFF